MGNKFLCYFAWMAYSAFTFCFVAHHNATLHIIGCGMLGLWLAWLWDRLHRMDINN
jgi:hypothetical protein